MAYSVCSRPSNQREVQEAGKALHKSYPGEMVHFDTKRLPLSQNQKATYPQDYLFVAIGGFSCEPHAAICRSAPQPVPLSFCCTT